MRAGIIALVIVVLLAIVAVYSGFINLSGDAGKLPTVAVEGGRAPSMDADVGKVVVGTKETSVEVPKVEVHSTKENIDVPVVGVKKANEE